MCVSYRWQHKFSTRLYTPIHTSPKTIIVGISKKSYQTFLQRLISDMHMIIQYPQNTIPRIPKRPTTPVTHPYISPVYMHCVFTQTRHRAAIIIALQTYMSYYHFDVLQRWLAVQKCKYLSLGVLWPSPNRQGWCDRGAGWGGRRFWQKLAEENYACWKKIYHLICK